MVEPSLSGLFSVQVTSAFLPFSTSLSSTLNAESCGWLGSSFCLSVQGFSRLLVSVTFMLAGEVAGHRAAATRLHLGDLERALPGVLHNPGMLDLLTAPALTEAEVGVDHFHLRRRPGRLARGRGRLGNARRTCHGTQVGNAG